MRLHPMIELSNDHQVRQAKGFKDAAAGLSGEELAGLYETELANAPNRAAAGKKFLVKVKPSTARRAHKDEEHLSLALLRHCRDSGEGMELPRVGKIDPAIPAKSGIMLGLGETEAEVRQTLVDVYASGCRMLTIGQYLQPTAQPLPVAEFISPEEFDRWRKFALEMGFKKVASGPFVRSSYHAGEMFRAD